MRIGRRPAEQSLEVRERCDGVGRGTIAAECMVKVPVPGAVGGQPGRVLEVSEHTTRSSFPAPLTVASISALRFSDMCGCREFRQE